MEDQIIMENKPTPGEADNLGDMEGDKIVMKRPLTPEVPADEEEKGDWLSSKKFKGEQQQDEKEGTKSEEVLFQRRTKKCALLLSYCGVGYAGMQMNPGVVTIEELLIEALHKARAITDEGKQSPGKMSFQRCARTDKGVSAARQVVNLKKSILEEANKHLPPAIRIIGFRRVTRGFDCKVNCTARTYEYLTPTYAFAPEMYTAVNYRITEERLEEVNEMLSRYVGTRNFHNFTSQKAFKDPSALRYIMSFGCGEPFEKDGQEFVVITVKGQSFMLHQIRKMIGLVICMLRGVAPKSTMEVSWKNRKVEVPRAPALGLMLAKVHFTGYNRRYGNDGIHETLEWEECEEEVEKFKEKFIHSHIVEKEIAERSMMKWLKSLYNHKYSDIEAEEAKAVEDEQSLSNETTTQEDHKEPTVSETVTRGNDREDELSPKVTTVNVVKENCEVADSAAANCNVNLSESKTLHPVTDSVEEQNYAEVLEADSSESKTLHPVIGSVEEQNCAEVLEADSTESKTLHPVTGSVEQNCAEVLEADSSESKTHHPATDSSEQQDRVEELEATVVKCGR